MGKEGSKKLTTYDYFMAVSIASESSWTVPIDTLPDNIDAHEEVEKQEAFEMLSDEARTVVKMILDSPNEILQLIKTPSTGRISKEAKKNLFTFFRKKWGWETKNIFREIEQWVNHL